MIGLQGVARTWTSASSEVVIVAATRQPSSAGLV